MSIQKLREHAAWSAKLEERAIATLAYFGVKDVRPSDLSRIVGSIVSREADRRNGRPETIPPARYFERMDGTVSVLSVLEHERLTAVIVEEMDARYGKVPT